jgi:PKD repeat protein
LSYAFTTEGTHQLKLVVTDKGGASDAATVSVVVTEVAPAVVPLTGATIGEGTSYTASGAFTDPGDDHWTATVDYGDGSGVQPLTLTGKTFSLAHSYSDNGSYEVKVVVRDDVGAAGVSTAIVTVNNVAPAVAVFPNGSIDEAGSYAASGSFTDPGDDHWVATADYGDGTGPQPLALAGKAFSLSHTYAASGQYTVTVTVKETDAEAGSGSQTAIVTVANVAPVVAGFAGATILRGESYSATGSFADPGADTWTATVNYGDGSASSALTLDGKGFALQHSYGRAGVYTVTVTVADADGGSGTRSATVTVLSSADGIARLASSVASLNSSGAVQGGDAKWLANKLDVAAKELDRGNTGPTRNQLQELIDRIESARAAGRLSADTAASLTAYANRVLASMS